MKLTKVDTQQFIDDINIDDNNIADNLDDNNIADNIDDINIDDNIDDINIDDNNIDDNDDAAPDGGAERPNPRRRGR